MTEPTLFDALDEAVEPATLGGSYTPGKAARRTDPATSHLAAQGIANTISARCAEVLLVHDRHPDRGLVDDELAQILTHRHPGGLAKRRLDVVVDGLIEPTDQLRPTRTGYSAIVYRITDLGRAVAARLKA